MQSSAGAKRVENKVGMRLVDVVVPLEMTKVRSCMLHERRTLFVIGDVDEHFVATCHG